MFCVKCFKKPQQEIDLQEIPKKLQQIGSFKKTGSFKTETNVPNPMNQETDEKQNSEVEL